MASRGFTNGESTFTVEGLYGGRWLGSPGDASLTPEVSKFSLKFNEIYCKNIDFFKVFNVKFGLF